MSTATSETALARNLDALGERNRELAEQLRVRAGLFGRRLLQPPAQLLHLPGIVQVAVARLVVEGGDVREGPLDGLVGHRAHHLGWKLQVGRVVEHAGFYYRVRCCQTGRGGCPTCP